MVGSLPTAFVRGFVGGIGMAGVVRDGDSGGGDI